MYLLRDQYIPIIRLYELFDLEPDTTELDQRFLVIVEIENRCYGFVIDDLMSQQQVVIKSLEK